MSSFRISRSALAIDQRFCVADWGSEQVLYDDATGACHLLSEAAAVVFELLRVEPETPRATAWILRALSPPPDEDPALVTELDAFVEALAGLREAGLIEECPE